MDFVLGFFIWIWLCISWIKGQGDWLRDCSNSASDSSFQYGSLDRRQDRTWGLIGLGLSYSGEQCPRRVRLPAQRSGRTQRPPTETGNRGGEATGRKDIDEVSTFAEPGRGGCPCLFKALDCCLDSLPLGYWSKDDPAQRLGHDQSPPGAPQGRPNLELGFRTTNPVFHPCNPAVIFFLLAALSAFHIFGSEANKGKALLRPQPALLE